MMVLEEYIDNLKNPMRSDIKKAALEALSDALVTAPLLRTMKDHANSRKNSFFYVFGHPTRVNFVSFFSFFAEHIYKKIWK